MATEASPVAPSVTADPAYFEIPKTCKAGVVVNEGPDFHVEVEHVPVPEPGPNEVLIRLNCTGLCNSDVAFMSSKFGLKMSDFGVRSPGHEGAGVIVKIGENVTNWKVGDRAGIKPMWSVCLKCDLCWNDKESWCPTRLNSGMRVTGSYQQYVTSPANYTQPIPDGVSDYAAGPIMCSAATMYRSIKESGMKHGQWAVFPGGGGGVGIQGVQIAAALGMRPIVVDTGDDKKELCLKLGAEHFIDFRKVEDIPKAIVEIADGIGAHGIFVTAPAAYKTALDCLGSRVGAVLMAVGIPNPSDPFIVGANAFKLIYQNITVKGTLTSSRSDIAQVMNLARMGKVLPVNSVVYPVDKFGEAVKKFQEGTVPGRIIVDFNM